jgi:hypothetical protein
MAMVVEMEIGYVAVFLDRVLLAGSLSSDFSSRGGFLYLGAFTKVVPFDDTMAAATIRAQLYGRTKKVPLYSCPLGSYTSSFEPRFLGVLWNLVSSTLML